MNCNCDIHCSVIQKEMQINYCIVLYCIVREVFKTTILEQYSLNHKIIGGVCVYPPWLTSTDSVFIA